MNENDRSRRTSQTSLLQWISRTESSNTSDANTGEVAQVDDVERFATDQLNNETETTETESVVPVDIINDYEVDKTNSKQFDGKTVKHWTHKKQHFARCEICFRNLNTVRLFVQNKLPALVQETGAVYRSRTIENHIKTQYHKEAVKSEHLRTMAPEQAYQCTPMRYHISAANEELANKMGKLMLHVYNDAKKLTLSAYSWPSRIVASEIASCFSFNQKENTSGFKMGFQYISPAHHRQLLKIIVSSHKEQLARSVTNALASSLRCDGSVDRTQVYKIFVMLKLISNAAEEELVFVGAREPKERGAEGLVNAIKKASKGCGKDSLEESSNDSEEGSDKRDLRNESLEFVLYETSSIVTGGTNVNSGERSGLWTLLEKLRSEKCPSDELVPLLKIWCAVHRSQLAWKM